MTFGFIEAEKASFPISRMCPVLGVSQSGVFAWQERPACHRQQQDMVYPAHIRTAFALFNGTYGSPRMHRETIHYHARFMRATNEAPGRTSQFRELIGSVDVDLDDATGRADLLNPEDYLASQNFGAERRAAGSNGITLPSIRYPEGQCIAVFWPDVITIPTQGAHFAYHWNGSAVDFVKPKDTGEVLEVT